MTDCESNNISFEFWNEFHTEENCECPIPTKDCCFKNFALRLVSVTIFHNGLIIFYRDFYDKNLLWVDIKGTGHAFFRPQNFKSLFLVHKFFYGYGQVAILTENEIVSKFCELTGMQKLSEIPDEIYSVKL